MHKLSFGRSTTLLAVIALLLFQAVVAAQGETLPLAAYGAEDGIYIVDLRSGESRLLVETAVQPNAVTWSPDGTRIAYVMLADSAMHDIFIYDTVSGETTRVAANPAEDLQPAWSPDGALLAYTSSAGGDYDIWLVDADCAAHDGGCAARARNLTASPADDRSPSWSADGATIAFVSNRDAEDSQVHHIFTMPAQGGGATRLTFAADQDASSVAWSPDGTRLAYRNGGVDDIGTVETIDVDGDNRRVLARGDMSYVLGWLPDSEQIVYGCWRQRTYQQCVIAANCGDSIAACSATRTIYEVGQQTLFSFRPMGP